jgi:nucleoside-diphosphate-sugar epimerase/glyoxylase-like metal-dependent hydrolase (beta-lactamase superfamily II)
MGRNRYRLGGAAHPHVQVVECDISNRDQLRYWAAQNDVLIHSAAMASAWGSVEDFQKTNVAGTQNIVDVCTDIPGVRLVHVSSTAVYFEFSDKIDVQDDAPYPHSFAGGYAESKGDSEDLVRDAAANGLNAIVLRARAVIGPGDNHLLPRLLAAASKGRLPQLGDGLNRVDLTYIDNLAYAICLAMLRGTPGSVCTITNQEPVLLWPTLKDILQRLELPPIRRAISYRTANVIAGVLETTHRLLRRSGEPLLTRYTAGLLAKSQTFSNEASQRVLDYRPLIRLQDGIDTTIASLREKSNEPAKTHVALKLFTTGYTLQHHHMVERGAPHKHVAIHATCALLQHPTRGAFLFDTGYATRFFSATKQLPYKLYAHITPVVTTQSLSIRDQLEKQGVAPEAIQGIILSHFHADHVCGILDFPGVDLICLHRAWNEIAHKRGIAALRRGILPSLFPKDIHHRLKTIEHFHDPGIGPFERSHDLFADGSVRLIELSGHACGQIGALIQTSNGHRVFLVADSVWTLGSLRANTMPHPLTYGFVYSIAEAKDSLARLHAFSKEFPDVEIIPTHCPEIAQRYQFDRIVAEHVAEERAKP